MVDRTNHIPKAREIDKLNEDTSRLRYQPPPPQRIHFKENLTNDDVIASLSNAYENRRARQVIEWERLYRQNIAA